jgi:hypothetical protein
MLMGTLLHLLLVPGDSLGQFGATMAHLFVMMDQIHTFSLRMQEINTEGGIIYDQFVLMTLQEM